MSLLAPNLGQSIRGIRSTGIEAQRLFQFGDCLVRLRHLHVQHSQARVRARKVWLDFERPPKQSLRLGLTTLLGADDAEQVQRAKFLRTGLRHRLQFVLGSLQLPGGNGLGCVLEEGKIPTARYGLTLERYRCSQKKEHGPTDEGLSKSQIHEFRRTSS
jgi:hypothetical protein